MTSISECFKSLREGGECALIPFITAGDPDLETTAKALMVLEAAGAAMIEGGSLLRSVGRCPNAPSSSYPCFASWNQIRASAGSG